MSDQFHVQYAIRMPSGDLYSMSPSVEAQTRYAEQYYQMPSPMRDYMGLMAPQPIQRKPMVWDSLPEAESVFNHMRNVAIDLGVTNWGGAIVSALRTPFTNVDPEFQFDEQLGEWMRGQGMV